MNHKEIKNTAILIGQTTKGKCVYSTIISLDNYWDGDHVWDNNQMLKKLIMSKLKGFLFGPSGDLLQEFESYFDLSTGQYDHGWVKHEDGTYQEN